MRDKMKLGDKVLFYHSNTKVPGVFALAEVAREGYPDWSAWDPAHPYFDEKTDKENPVWMMVDVKFNQRLAFPPTLALIKHLASVSSLPESIAYIGADGLKAVQAMQLVNRGRLSVQPVEDAAYDAVVLLGTSGGWEDLVPSKSKAKSVKAENGDEVEKPEVKKGKKRASGAAEAGKGKKVKVEKTAPAEAAAEVEGAAADLAVADKPIPDDGLRRSKRGKR